MDQYKLRAEIERTKQQLIDVKSGWEFAFAHAACGYGGERRPEFLACLATVRRLERRIAWLAGKLDDDV